jgi:parvulin-like peptidyl-prolyl isomerase
VILRKGLFAAICGIFLSVNLSAALIDAVSVTVDNEPITIYEIYRLSSQYDIPTKEALEILIRQKLEVSQIKQMNIQVDDFVLNQQIETIAAKNNMTIQSFYGALLREGVSADAYRAELKQKMQRDRLYQYILSSKYENIDEDKLLVYYNNNPVEFTRFESFEVVKFESADAEELAELLYGKDGQADENQTDANEVATDEAAANQTDVVYTDGEITDESNADANETNESKSDEVQTAKINTAANQTAENEADESQIEANRTAKSDTDANQTDENETAESEANPDQGVKRSNEHILSVDEEPRIVALLSQSEVGERTPIIQTQDGFAAYVIIAKNGKSVIPFDQVKNSLKTKLSSDQETTIIKEYFETIRSRASITIIRLP